jgi:ABC-2 type transport system ATP-binding protein
LDEPTIGLDAVSKLALRGFLGEMNRKQGVTMILTTHDMDDIETLCNRVMVIGRGSILFDGQLEKLKKQYAGLRRIRAKLAGSCSLPTLPGAEHVEIKGNECIVTFKPEVVAAHEIVAVLASACPLVDIVVEEEDIDEIIAGMYREMRL